MRIIYLISALAVLILCQSCSRVENMAINREAPVQNSERRLSVGFCELLQSPDRFDGKDIQISAILITGREYAYLYDPVCVSDANFIWYRYENDAASAKLNFIINPENPEYRSSGLIRVKADFYGTFETKKDKGFGHEGFFNHKLTIRDINNVASVPSSVPYPWPSPLAK